jgi:hypothetical protein
VKLQRRRFGGETAPLLGDINLAGWRIQTHVVVETKSNMSESE